MILVTLLALRTLAMAARRSEYGTLHISAVESKPAYINLVIEKDTVFASDVASIFRYGGSSSLVSLSSKKHVTVNEKGKLVMSGKPETGFVLHASEVSGGRRILSYNGEQVFQLCSDHSIGFKSNCGGAQDVRISYYDFSSSS
ncbi:hypothetical protein JCM33374_g1370 [Metschnikowia sp. JCM 33374]|nr:hypothetical protein JCM33374_g1370 [Metschnikowia sp. JCM 33374]